MREGKERKRGCGKEMTGNNGWGSERVEDGKDNVKAEEKEQKQRREKRVLHPSDSAALASTRLCPRVTPASRHCAHDASHHTEADSRGREPRPCAATAGRADAAARPLQDKMQQELLLSRSPHSAQSAGVSLARCEDGCPRLSESRTQTWWSRSSNHLLAPRAIVLYFFKERKKKIPYVP